MLEVERARFDELREELLAHHRGKFALIVDSDLVGVFDRPSDAYDEGIRRFGNRPLLVEPISEENGHEAVPALTLGILGAHK